MSSLCCSVACLFTYISFYDVGAAPAVPAAADENNNGTVERAEFPQFIFHMAIADLKSVQSME
jgi:hypothetical protein